MTSECSNESCRQLSCRFSKRRWEWLPSSLLTLLFSSKPRQSIFRCETSWLLEEWNLTWNFDSINYSVYVTHILGHALSWQWFRTSVSRLFSFMLCKISQVRKHCFILESILGSGTRIDTKLAKPKKRKRNSFALPYRILLMSTWHRSKVCFKSVVLNGWEPLL